jgi:hypothetical protein
VRYIFGYKRESMRGRYKFPHFVRREVDSEGCLRTEEYYFDARRLLHRDPDAGPAYVSRYGDAIMKAEYRWHGLLHRDDGPALLTYFDDGWPWIEGWFRFNRCHRDPQEGPAYVCWRWNRVPEVYSYYLHDYDFRDPRVGPHSIKFDRDTGEEVGWHYLDEIPPCPKPPYSWFRKTYGPKP